MYKCQNCTHCLLRAATKRGCRDSMYCNLLGETVESERKTDAVQGGAECADHAKRVQGEVKW